MFTVRESESQDTLQRIIQLRVDVLRKPWNQPAETATDNLEASAVNAYIEDRGKVVACGRLQDNGGGVGQVRFMAVDPEYQGQGLGNLIMLFLEKRAMDLNLSVIELQARENAVSFYKRNGYTIQEKTFLLWGIIQHYLMVKKIQ